MIVILMEIIMELSVSTNDLSAENCNFNDNVDGFYASSITSIASVLELFVLIQFFYRLIVAILVKMM